LDIFNKANITCSKKNNNEQMEGLDEQMEVLGEQSNPSLALPEGEGTETYIIY
jgi:hypothetical protein